MTKNNALFLKININTQVIFFLNEEGNIYTNGLMVCLNHKSTENRLKNDNLLPFQLTAHNNLTVNFTKYVFLILKGKLQPKTSLKWVQVVKVYV